MNIHPVKLSVLRLKFIGLLIPVILAACNLPSKSAVPAAPGTAFPPSNQLGNVVVTALAITATPQIKQDPRATDMATTDICSMLPKEEVEAVLGEPVLGMKPDSNADEVTGNSADSCAYFGASAAVILTVTQSNAAKDSPEWAQNQLDYVKATTSGVPTMPVSGLGDGAQWYASEKGGGFVVAKFPYLFGVVIGGNNISPNDHQAGLKQLVSLVLSRLS